jgi:3-phenylpropionate/trans-cinnamate dioxygenase ferredoxin reductase subunit
MPVVRADLTICQGYGNCVIAADDVFDIGEDGTVLLLRAAVPESDRARVEEAVACCPTSALVVEG